MFEEAEALAKQLRLSRSELYAKALKVYLQVYNRDRLWHKLNQVSAQESADPDPVLTEM